MFTILFYDHLRRCLISLFIVAMAGNAGALSSQDAQFSQGSAGTILSAPAKVNVSGRITYDRVLVVDTPRIKLDYTQTFRRPARGVLVEAINQQNAVLARTVTDKEGYYALKVPSKTPMKLRVYAQLKGTNQAGAHWNFAVRDNTSPAFVNNPARAALYTMQSRIFKSGATGTVQNLHAASGWTGARYSAARTAAPFAILDTIYLAKNRILKVNPQHVFKPLNIFWSIHNRPAAGNPALGEIGSDHFIHRDVKKYGIYLLGKEDVEISEYDTSTILHEWTHYFEHSASRTDAIGGSHRYFERLDMRVAFAEGFASAFASMLADDPRHLITQGPQQASGWGFSLAEIAVGTPRPWYSEGAVGYALYQFYRAPGIGLTSIYQTLVSERYKQMPAFLSLFSFADTLRRRLDAKGWYTLDTILAQTHTVNGAYLDAYGTRQFRPSEIPKKFKALILPIYTFVGLGVPPVTVCASKYFGSIQYLNKLSNRRYLRFNIPANGYYRLTVYGNERVQPMIIVYQTGKEIARDQASSVGSSAVVHKLFGAGNYVAEVFNWPWPDSNHKCFDVMLTQ